MRNSKTVANPSGIENLLERLSHLKSSDRAKWGSMNAAEMLYHCNRANFSILNKQLPFTTNGLYAWSMKLFFLYLAPRLPKHIKGPSKLDPKNRNVSLDSFEREKNAYKSTIPQFLEWKSPQNLVHPFLGPMSEKEWKRFIWMHMDHHFRQFGI